MPVVQNRDGARQRGAGQEIPQHPAGGGEKEQSFRRMQVEVKGGVFQVLEQNAAVTVHDGFGQSGGTG